MSIKAFLLAALTAIAVFSCTTKEEADKAARKTPNPQELQDDSKEVHGPPVQKVELTNPLNQQWVATGQQIYDSKCLACHKLTDERVVGPGWAGVTKRREPEWIINMITNVDMMLATDPEAQKMLEQCLVRMPNQNVSPEDARKILEFMRKNDGES